MERDYDCTYHEKLPRSLHYLMNEISRMQDIAETTTITPMEIVEGVTANRFLHYRYLIAGNSFAIGVQ